MRASNLDLRSGCLLNLLQQGLVDVCFASTPGCHEVLAPNLCTGVRATEAEGENAIVGSLGPEDDAFREDVAIEARHVDVWVQCRDVLVRCAFSVDAHQHAFDESGYASTTLAMPDVGLRAGDDHGFLAVLRHHDFSVSAQLYRVSKRGACAVTLGRIHLFWPDVCLLQGRQGALLLRRAIWRSERGALAVLVGLATSQHGVVPILAGELLQLGTMRRRGLSTGVAISCHVVSEASTLVREHAGSTSGDEGLRDEQQIGACSNACDTGVYMLVLEVELCGVRSHQRC
mmetsp:Transcript_69852/g.151965  ORF Transcript_69852/g.151965 Transcript_69852/m.151965 type:complete len:287 (-) Transcript_69852:41-901(-)